MKIAEAVMKKKGRLLGDHCISQGWWHHFRERWPEISLCEGTGNFLSMARKKTLSQKVLESYFDLLQETLDRYKLKDKPSQIYNCNESSMPLENKPPRSVSAQARKKVRQISSSNKTRITILSCCNASGQTIPPMVVFSGKRFNNELSRGEVPGTLYGMSDSGLIDQELFATWFSDHFLQHAASSRPLLLLLDGHSSHYTLDLIRSARANDVTIFCLPPHTTSDTQFLDASCFGPLKAYWSEACREYMFKSPGRVVSKFQFSQLFSYAWSKGMSIGNITMGFRNTGICPFNRYALLKTLPLSPEILDLDSENEVSDNFSSNSIIDEKETDNEDRVPGGFLGHIRSEGGDGFSGNLTWRNTDCEDEISRVFSSYPVAAEEESEGVIKSRSPKSSSSFNQPPTHQSSHIIYKSSSSTDQPPTHQSSHVISKSSSSIDQPPTHQSSHVISKSSSSSDQPPTHQSSSHVICKSSSSTGQPPTHQSSHVISKPSSSTGQPPTQSLCKSEFRVYPTPIRKTTLSASNRSARVFISAESRQLLKEKESKGEKEVEEKAKQKSERAGERVSEEKGKGKKLAKREAKVEERAKRISGNKTKAKGNNSLVEFEMLSSSTRKRKLPGESLTSPKTCPKRKRMVETNKQSEDDVCSVCAGLYINDLQPYEWIQCTNEDCGVWSHVYCLEETDSFSETNIAYICAMCDSVFL